MSLSNTEFLAGTIKQSLQEVVSDFKDRGQFGGWHQFFDSPKIGIVASAQALLVLEGFGIKLQSEHLAYQFLIQQQKSGGAYQINGGWSYITNLSDASNTESTCWALQALMLKPDEFGEQITNGLAWLLANIATAPTDQTGWGCLQADGFRLYSTCIALRVLNALCQQETNPYKLALETFKRARNEDGGWGDVYKSTSTLVHSALAVICLLECGLAPTSKEVAGGVQWIVNALNMEGYARDILMGYTEIFDLKYEVDGQQKDQRIHFNHMPLPVALTALIKAGYPDEKLIQHGVHTLMAGHEHGHWRHPYLPKQKTLWAIFDVLSFFRSFQESVYAENFDAFVPKRAATEKKKFDVIIFTVVPVEFNTINTLFNFAPIGKQEDHVEKGLWYYEYLFSSEKNGELSCLITMIGGAGEVDCSIACQTTFAAFECDLAVLCGIAAGIKEEIKKYSAIVADVITSYEFQRWEKDKVTFRPKFYTASIPIKRLNTKVSMFKQQYRALYLSYLQKLEIEISALPNAPADADFKSGVIASGAKLLADGKTIEALRVSIPVEKGIMAAEMEGSGFAAACWEHKKEWLVFRGISDYGEDDKNDPNNKKFQPAAVASAAAAMNVYLNYIYQKPQPASTLW